MNWRCKIDLSRLADRNIAVEMFNRLCLNWLLLLHCTSELMIITIIIIIQGTAIPRGNIKETLTPTGSLLELQKKYVYCLCV